MTKTVLALNASVLATSGAPADRVLGAGIVMPGPFGATGIHGSGSELPIWDDVAPDQWFSDALGLPVVVENDANAAAIAERVSGVAQGLETYAFVYFGSGLGLGVVQNGSLMTGAYGNAGEIGHIPVPLAGRIVSLESAVSRLSVQNALRAAGVAVASVDDLHRLHGARDRDPHRLARCGHRASLGGGGHRREPFRPANRDPGRCDARQHPRSSRGFGAPSGTVRRQPGRSRHAPPDARAPPVA